MVEGLVSIRTRPVAAPFGIGRPLKNRKVLLVEPDNLRRGSAYPGGLAWAHQIGLRQVLVDHGYEVRMLDAYSRRLSTRQFAGEVNRFNPAVVGVTTYAWPDSVGYLYRVIPKLQGRVVVLGGVGATYSPVFFAQTFKPAFLVRGEGELPLGFLAQNNFFSGLPILGAEGSAVGISALKQTIIVEGLKPIPLDLIGFERPYELSDYGFRAAMEYQRGCIGRCNFCVGKVQKNVRYKSPARAVQEVLYLVNEKKAKHIQHQGTDFTANPKKATAIIEALNQAGVRGLSFQFGCRADTLAAALRQSPEIWERFMKENRVKIEIGYESSIPRRLMRMGKAQTLSAAQKNLSNLLFILDKNICELIACWILLDPQSTPVEVVLDLEIMIAIMRKYRVRFWMPTDALINRLIPTIGTETQALSQTWLEEHGDELIRQIPAIIKSPSNQQLGLRRISLETNRTRKGDEQCVELAIRMLNNLRIRFIRALEKREKDWRIQYEEILRETIGSGNAIEQLLQTQT